MPNAQVEGGANGLLEVGLGDASLARRRASGPFDDFTDALTDAVGEINDTVDEAVAAINDTLHDAIDNLTADTSSNLMEYSVGQVPPTRQDGPELSDATLDAVKVVLEELNKIELGKAEHEIDGSSDTIQRNIANLSGNDSGAWEGNMQEGSLLQRRLSDPLDDLVDGLQGIVDEVNKTVQTAISNISDAFQDALDNLSDSTTDMYYASWQPWSAWQEWYITPSLLATRTREPGRTVDEVQTPSLGQADADRPAGHELDDADGGS
jgi:flagellar hook-basal body complex protein FliE